jgi:prepilin-type N-terminal cleavage/methylation domain-containing protein
MKIHQGGSMRGRKQKREGFSLIEVVIGIALVAIAVLGLAQMFTLGIMNNLRSERIANASFLAQQQIDVMRNLTSDELTTLSAADGVDLNGDGTLDINSDGKSDYRRITEVQAVSSGANVQFEVRVLVFSAEQMAVSKDQLILNPMNYHVQARVNTVISR